VRPVGRHFLHEDARQLAQRLSRYWQFFLPRLGQRRSRLNWLRAKADCSGSVR